jgi:hypothetical protein
MVRQNANIISNNEWKAQNVAVACQVLVLLHQMCDLHASVLLLAMLCLILYLRNVFFIIVGDSDVARRHSLQGMLPGRWKSVLLG